MMKWARAPRVNASGSEMDPLVPPDEKEDTTPPAEGGDTVEEAVQESSYEPKSSFSDHFSLEAPSDEVRFRGCAVRVYSSGTQQFQLLEEESSEKIKAKVSSDGSTSLSFLRVCYSMVAVLMMGLLLIFCIQVLLFLFVSLISEGGFTSHQSLNTGHMIGTVLSVPVFVYGLASSLTMATEFVSDTWHGHQFFRSVLRIPVVVIDWFYFLLFLGIPFMVMIFKMFTSEYWWETTALVWFGCITFAFCVFCLMVFVIEVWGALELLAHHPDHELINVNMSSLRKFIQQAIRLRECHSYSGVEHRTFLIEGTKAYPSPNVSYADSNLADHEFTVEKVSLYSKLTKYLPGFVEYDKPKRKYNIEDVLDRMVFITDRSWNLEKMFCRRQLARQVMVVNGPSRLLPSQISSSLACAIIGNVFYITLFAAFMSWGGVPPLGVVILTLLFAAVNMRHYLRIYAIHDTYKDTIKRREESGTPTSDEADGEVIYQVTETHYLTKPSPPLVWILFVLEITFLFAIPLWQLFDIGNACIARLFLLLAVFSACRHYFNAPVVLGELGSLDLLDGEFVSSRDDVLSRSIAQAKEDWAEKNRLSKIVARISQGDRRDAWRSVILGFVFAFAFVFVSAFKGGSNTGSMADVSNIIHDFSYVPKNDTFKYPTCDLTKEFQIPGSDSNGMADYAYMAGIAYNSPDSMPELLDTWFGEGVAHDNNDKVLEFRKTQELSAVHYKLITFPQNPDFAVVAIRGTNNGWDMISDAQLWSSAVLTQIVRAILPLGAIWNPMLDNLVKLIAIVQSKSLRQVAFYRQTTAFVQDLNSKKAYSLLRVTGHSLGGGLAMITGAQSQTPAIALSGPNTIISKDTLDPPVSLDDLNSYTFNIIPSRDPVPLIDDPAKNVQHIACLAKSNRFVDCHTATRSLCEIQYTCGSGERPTLCDCALYYGYPEPEATGDRTFAEACRK